MALEPFTAGAFSGTWGKTFRVRPGTSDPLEAGLVSASGLGEERDRPLPIVPRCPGDVVLPQRTCPGWNTQVRAL